MWNASKIFERLSNETLMIMTPSLKDTRIEVFASYSYTITTVSPLQDSTSQHGDKLSLFVHFS